MKGALAVNLIKICTPLSTAYESLFKVVKRCAEPPILDFCLLDKCNILSNNESLTSVPTFTAILAAIY